MARSLTIVQAIRLWSDSGGYHFSCKCCDYSAPEGFPTRPERVKAITLHLAQCQSFNNADGKDK